MEIKQRETVCNGSPAVSKEPLLILSLGRINAEADRQNEIIKGLKMKIDILSGTFPDIECKLDGTPVSCVCEDLEGIYSKLAYNTEQLSSLRIRLSELI